MDGPSHDGTRHGLFYCGHAPYPRTPQIAREQTMQDYEKLGAFYLGTRYDPVAQAPQEDLLLYDAKDLTTHAVCVGMTGSGKTGLCLALLEEAAIDGIPAIAIDPKGDLGNLLLTFPRLQPTDFLPWVDPAEAARQGCTPEQYAGKVAKLWEQGLAKWGQDGGRIARFRDAADLAIYTPGSSAGLQLSLLRSFAAPSSALAQDSDAFRERVSAAVSGLLALLGVDADPLRSREHILLSNLLEGSWRQGQDLDLPGLIRAIQDPPFDTIGVLPLESFFPAKERLGLSMILNNLLASPGFSAWMEGEPLEIPRLLWTPEGKPRISILSIAHLSDAERMFFVTTVLNEVLAWMRAQPGTASLRALLYMDEVFGYFPPTANPPSKAPMLTLLKQARAFGLGVVLATQNPVDLDYKGLSNAGTWFLGRLQTERDKARVLEGLEGASAAAGTRFDRQRMDATLSGLRSRVFLMNNVHEDEPALFQTRWCLSYLRGPLTRAQIQTLMAPRREAAPAVAAGPGVSSGRPSATPVAEAAQRPVVPADVPEVFLPWQGSLSEQERLVYRPFLLGTSRLHFVKAKEELDHWETVSLWAPLDAATVAEPWAEAEAFPETQTELETEGDDRARFGDLPAEAALAKSYTGWAKSLADHLYRSRVLTLWRCEPLRETSRPQETEGQFRVRLGQLARERRDLERAKLEKRYAPKLARLQERIRTAEARLQREQEQYDHQKLQTAISFGASVLGALFGRKLASVGTVGRATTAARGVGRAAKERGEMARAQEELEVQRQKLAELDEQFRDDVARIQDALDPNALELTPLEIRPRKSDISVAQIALLWAPWRMGPDGIAEAAYL